MTELKRTLSLRRSSPDPQRIAKLVDEVSSKSASPSSTSDSPDGLSPEDVRAEERIDQLETELIAKDELVTALTVQLEQLAEQLDRLQRSGADRKRAASGGGLPADVIEGQRKVVGDLERVVQQWEDMQAGLMLGRIEVQLTELRDFIAERLTGEAASPRIGSRERTSAFPTLPSSMVLERITVTSKNSGPETLETTATEVESHDASAPPSPSMWESMKSQMLEEKTSDSTQDFSDAAVPEEEPDAPAAIDTASASSEQLETALNERDSYIAYLLRKIRRLTPAQTPPDWVSLESVPEELRQTLESQTKKLEEHLRMAEIELSMERARLSRAQMQLNHQQDAIEKQMRRLGLKTLDEHVTPQQEEAAPADRRWVRFLGMSRGS